MASPPPDLRSIGPRRSWEEVEGSPLPMGATWMEAEQAWNFALYSEHAERVVLLIYAPEDVTRPVLTRELDYLHNKSGHVWHCRVDADELIGGAYYAFQVSGPAADAPVAPRLFDPEKILLDPYARAVFLPTGFDRRAATSPGTNAGKAPLGLMVASSPAPNLTTDRRRHEWDAVVYELHVRGFTMSPTAKLDAATRGTFAGVSARIPYLKELGVTVVELMPVFQYDPQGNDRWGYTPLGFFAPHAGYARRGDARRARDEFREMVDALHAADIEVVLDVVYNHTCERGLHGPTYSFKGIDNSTYYLLSGNPANPYVDFTGAENTLNCSNGAVRRLILDSMHMWALEMGVDGFRFDLASVFGRRADGTLSLHDAPVIGDVSTHEELMHLRLIAEPWDATGLTALGHAFPGTTWQQWNGWFRDDVRRFVRGDPGMVPALMRRLYGSDDLFPDDLIHAYRPPQSVNYVTCHDGFTLYDLVSYNTKRNWANGHENRDGAVESCSWNCGWEGDEHVPNDVRALRTRQAKNFIAMLMLANGMPMLRAGDEFLQTQGGNDNPYNQDNPTTWLNWDLLDANRDMFRFVKHAIAFRKAHPSIGRSRFWRDDVRWYGVGPNTDMSRESRSLAYALHGASHNDVDLYVMINTWQEPLTFDIQEGTAADWRRAIDTARPSPEDIRVVGDERPLESLSYIVGARSVVVLVKDPHPRAARQAAESY
jgi:isoamylase